MQLEQQAIAPGFIDTIKQQRHDNMPRLIGLTGVARSGKDTVGNILVNDFRFKTVYFAEPLKEGLKLMLGLTDEHVHGSLKETVVGRFGKSPRQMLQTLGTDWARNLVNQDTWLIVAKYKIEELMEQGYSVSLTDVRFDNEADMVREMGGQVWHIYRPGVEAVNAHTSEAGVSFDKGADLLLTNDGTLEELSEEVHDAYYHFRGIQ